MAHNILVLGTLSALHAIGSLPFVTKLRVLDSSLKCKLESIYIIHCGPEKNVPLYCCPYLRQLLINFQNSFTGILCRHFAIM